MRKKIKISIILTTILFSISVQGSISETEIKTGEIEWERTFGTSKMEAGWVVITASDGGFAIMGFAWRSGEGYYLIIKTDASGNMEWNNTYKVDTLFCFDGCGFIQTLDDGYAIVGNKGHDSVLLKFDSTGNFQWDSIIKMHEGNYIETGNAVIQLQDGSYIIVGGGSSSYLVKTDSKGNEIWNHSFGKDGLKAVQQASDGGFILGGSSDSKESSRDVLLIKTDSNGNAIWNKTYGGSAPEILIGVIETEDKGFAISGNLNTEFKGVDYLLMKTDSAGNLEWNKSFGGEYTDAGAMLHPLIETSDGGYAFIGTTTSFGIGKSDIWLIKTDANGNVVWDETYGGKEDEYTNTLVKTADGGIVFVSNTNSKGAGDHDVWLVKIKGPIASLSIGKASPIPSWPAIIALAFVSLIIYKKRRIKERK